MAQEKFVNMDNHVHASYHAIKKQEGSATQQLTDVIIDHSLDRKRPVIDSEVIFEVKKISFAIPEWERDWIQTEADHFGRELPTELKGIVYERKR